MKVENEIKKEETEMSERGFEHYAVLAIAAHRCDGLFETDYLTGLAALGLWELERAGLIAWDEHEIRILGDLTTLPPELSCFQPLAEAILQAAKGGKQARMCPVWSAVLSRYSRPLSQAVAARLVEKGLCHAGGSRGLTGRHEAVTADPEAVRRAENAVLLPQEAEEAEAERLVLAEVLLNSGEADACFDRNQRKILRASLSEAPAGKAGRLVKDTLDQIAASLAAVTTLLGSE